MGLKIIANKLIVYGIFLMLLPTLSYADALTDNISEALLKINNFLDSNQYEAYANLIDFVFFSLLFVSVYLIGARYGFRELGKPEKTIAVLLGFLTAFLLVSGGFSIIELIPYVSWIVYFLIFLVVWLVLKGIHSKFGRFLLALIITLIIIALIGGYFENLDVVPLEG